jgi:hypothetical protein
MKPSRALKVGDVTLCVLAYVPYAGLMHVTSRRFLVEAQGEPM